jgi:hypothetical protein
MSTIGLAQLLEELNRFCDCEMESLIYDVDEDNEDNSVSCSHLPILNRWWIDRN